VDGHEGEGAAQGHRSDQDLDGRKRQRSHGTGRCYRGADVQRLDVDRCDLRITAANGEGRSSAPAYLTENLKTVVVR
jgi:hypothetical protein